MTSITKQMKPNGQLLSAVFATKNLLELRGDECDNLNWLASALTLLQNYFRSAVSYMHFRCRAVVCKQTVLIYLLSCSMSSFNVITALASATKFTLKSIQDLAWPILTSLHMRQSEVDSRCDRCESTWRHDHSAPIKYLIIQRLQLSPYAHYKPQLSFL